MVTNELKWTPVQSDEIEKANFRFEANVFNIDARAAKNRVINGIYPICQLKDLLQSCYYGGRAKRNYVQRNEGKTVGFLGSAEMLEINPKPIKFFSNSTKNIESFKVKEGTILISRSGTIGNVTIVNKTLSKHLISEHAIRIVAKEFAGYIYVYLKTNEGKAIVQSNIFGAVIQQIEPEHILEIIIPNATEKIKKEIHEKVMRSFALRDESNELIEKAEKLLMDSLGLPDFNSLKSDLYAPNEDIQTFVVNLDLLNDRFEGSYHMPIVNKIIDCLLDSGASILPLGSGELTSKIILPLRFKRVYVEEEYGKVFFGGKQIQELDPSGKKYLSNLIHGSRMVSQLLLKENTILVTRSGTVGKVNIVPKHWNEWIANDHIMRVTPTSKTKAGYLYIWLNSNFGKAILQSLIYGSVVDEIEPEHLAKVPIPILKDEKKIKEINDLALWANELRSEAYYLEQDAIKQMNEEVIFATK